MDKKYEERINKASAWVRERVQETPQLGLILGSGLSGIVDQISGQELSYRQIEGFLKPSVEGHRGVLKINPEIAVMAGRFHYYEGHPIQDVVLPIYLLHKLGVKQLIITNAAGGINRSFKPGDIALIKDHINLQGTNPLIGPNNGSFGPRFPDMSEAYSPALRSLAGKIGEEQQIRLQEGVYAALSGPCYETPAEIRMLRTLGADMVGMSTVPEVIVANYLGMEVLGLSCITNMAAGMLDQPLIHEEVIETGKKAEGTLTNLILEILRRLKD